MDGNLHAGPKLVPKDPNLQNQNGKLFEDFIERNPFLSIGNNMDSCTGDITRKRILDNRTEQAILDFFLFNDRMRPFVSKIVIDDDKKYCLSNFAQLKKNKRVVDTDHNLMIADLDISVPKRKADRTEILNLKNIN